MSLTMTLGIVISFDRDLLSHVLFTRLHWNGRLAGSFQYRWDTCESLEAVCDDVAIERVEFHQERIATALFSSDQRRPASTEEVQHVLTLH